MNFSVGMMGKRTKFGLSVYKITQKFWIMLVKMAVEIPG